MIDICLYFTSLEQLSDPLHRSGWLIFACILQVLSNYPIPFIAQDDWYLLVFYNSWAIIRSPSSVRMIGICLYFTSLEQLSKPTLIGRDGWYVLVFYQSWEIIWCPSSLRMRDIWFYVTVTSLEQLSDHLDQLGWLIFACILQVLSNYPVSFMSTCPCAARPYTWFIGTPLGYNCKLCVVAGVRNCQTSHNLLTPLAQLAIIVKRVLCFTRRAAHKN